jgi:hypothetical protein
MPPPLPLVPEMLPPPSKPVSPPQHPWPQLEARSQAQSWADLGHDPTMIGVVVGLAALLLGAITVAVYALRRMRRLKRGRPDVVLAMPERNIGPLVLNSSSVTELELAATNVVGTTTGGRTRAKTEGMGTSLISASATA